MLLDQIVFERIRTSALLRIGFRVSVAPFRVARGASRRGGPALNRSTGTLILCVNKALVDCRLACVTLNFSSVRPPLWDASGPAGFPDDALSSPGGPIGTLGHPGWLVAEDDSISRRLRIAR